MSDSITQLLRGAIEKIAARSIDGDAVLTPAVLGEVAVAMLCATLGEESVRAELVRQATVLAEAFCEGRLVE